MTAVAPTQHDDFELAYRRFEQPLLKKARRWFPSLRGTESDLYQSAWESLLRNGDSVDDIEKYLEQALYSRGVDELRARRLRPAVSLETARARHTGTAQLDAEPGGEDGRRGPDSVVERTAPLPEEQVEIREDALLVTELLAELTPLQQQIVAVRWGWGLRRKQAAPLLGISERSAKRALEEAIPTITRNVELVREGRWCEDKRSLILAYSFDLLSTKRAVKAERHLAACVACRYVARTIQIRLERVAALAPVPVLGLEPPGSEPFTRAAELVQSAWGALADLASSVKHHAVAILTRTPAGEAAAVQVAAGGGLRGGGGAIAAVTACLAAGGGATYCAVEGVPAVVRDFAGIERSQEQRKNRHPKDLSRQEPSTTPKPVIAAPQPTGNGAGGPPAGDRPEPKPSETVVPASPAPPGSTEFGMESARAARAPAPAPADGGGEFTP